MKQKSTFFILMKIIIFKLLILNAVIGQGKRYALLMGINDFQQQDIPSLVGENDVNLVEKSLLQQGFITQNVIKLLGPQATFQAFATQMEALIRRCAPGDLVLLHLSTHGLRLADIGILDENDNFDEAIAFYNLKAEPQGFHSGYLLDDDFAQYIQRIRNNLGPNGQFIAVLDACFSAGLNRGDETVSKQYEKSPLLEVRQLPSNNETIKLAPSLFISSSEGNQVTQTLGGINCSVLSYAFSKHFAQLSNRMSFQAFFDELKATITSIDIKQHPQMAGDPHAFFLFGGRNESIYKHQGVEKVIDRNRVQISGGEIAEHMVGEEVIFMPADKSLADTLFTKPLAMGKIIETRIWSSLVETREVTNDLFLKNWVYVSRINLRREACFMKIALHNPEKRRELAMAFGVDNLPSYEQNPLYLIQQNGSLIQVYDNTGFLLLAVQEREQDWAFKVKNVIQAHRQCMLLRKTNWQDPNIVPLFNMQLTSYRTPRSTNDLLVPKQYQSLEKRRDMDGIHLYADQDTITLSIENRGNADFYYTIVDVQPDHRLNLLAPLPQENDFTNYFLKVGQKKELAYPLVIAPPLGTEYFILIATSKPLVNLTQILTRGIHNSNTSNSNFENMLNAITDPKMWTGKDAPEKLVQPNQTTIKKIIFTIE